MSTENPSTPPAPTRLSVLRNERGIQQIQMALAMGISPATYRRLEKGQMPNPPLRYLVNAAILLRVELDEVIEDEWRTWLILEPIAGEKPRPTSLLWRKVPERYRRSKS